MLPFTHLLIPVTQYERHVASSAFASNKQNIKCGSTSVTHHASCHWPTLLHYNDRWHHSSYLWSNLRLVIGQKVVVEFGTVEHACERLGGGGVGLGRKAVVARCCWSRGASDRFWRLVTCAINWRLLRETLMRQEVGLDSFLSARRLGYGWSNKSLLVGVVVFVCILICLKTMYILVNTSVSVSVNIQ